MIYLLLLLSLADPGGHSVPKDECRTGGSGAQCVTCVPSDRGTIVCRGVCYHLDPKHPRPDGGYRSESLRGEDKDENGARRKVDAQAQEKCG